MNRLFAPVAVVWLILVLLLSLAGCGRPDEITIETPAAEPPVPAHFTTYNDVSGIFSISYPPEWEPGLSLIGEFAVEARNTLDNMASGMVVDRASLVFLAGLPGEDRYSPNFNIIVEPAPANASNHDEFVVKKIADVKSDYKDYRQNSHTRTTVGGRQASIIDWTTTIPQMGDYRFIQMFILEGKTVWIITCSPEFGEFEESAADFQSVVRSLRLSPPK